MYAIFSIVDVVMFDFAEAFDVVSHHLLLDKFGSLGVCSPLLDWTADFRIGHVMRISVSGIRSSFVDVRSGVSQRSVLDPLLFILFVNHLSTFRM